jgi:hypothetical protein
MLHAAQPLTLCSNGVDLSAALERIDTTTCEGMAMPLPLNVNGLVKDGARVLTDQTGKPGTFSQEQTVQQQVSMIVLGARCDLPKRQLATGFGGKTRQSYDDIRNAVRNGSRAALLPKRPAPRTPPKRTQAVEAGSIRPRVATELHRSASAEALTHLGCTISARRVGPVLTDSGLAKKTGLTGLPPRAAPRPRGDRNPRWRLPAAPTPRHAPRHRP